MAGADGAGASGAGVLSSKLISLNIGADIGAKSSGMFAWSSNAMSKSDGSGKLSFICSFVSTSISVIGDWAGVSVVIADRFAISFVVSVFSCAVDCALAVMFARTSWRARINAACNSGGMSGDNSGEGSLLSWSVLGVVSVAGAGHGFLSSGIFGTGIVTSGAFLRIISVVVAT